MRQNPRGYFLKLTQSTPTLRKFVAIPAEILYKFEENFVELLDRYGPSQDETSPPSEFGFSLFFATGFYLFFFLFIRNRLYSGSPHNSHPQSLPEPHEVRAGSKTFYFDVERNDRGVYVRLTEVGEVHIQFTLC